MIRCLTDRDVRNVENVFLDLDGTISKSGEGCMNATRYMLEKIGKRDVSDQEVAAFVGPTVRMHLQNAYGFTKEEAVDAYMHYRAYYDSTGIYENYPYDGIAQAMAAMRQSGKTLYVGTLKPEVQAHQILARYGYTDMFAGIFGARHDLGILEKEGVLERAAEIIGEVPQNAIMVGDRYHDVLAGRHMGFLTVGVLYGYGGLSELTESGCDIIVDTVADLSELLGEAACKLKEKGK